MKKQTESRIRLSVPMRTVTVMSIILIAIAVLTTAFNKNKGVAKTDKKIELKATIENDGYIQDSAESVKAFMKVYQVLTSPRCMNCHPSGDVPLQGDDNHLHSMLPQRGKDGKGVSAMKCGNCHQPTNIAGLNTPPGDPNWHLPPPNMKMVFQGKTPNQLAKQLMDRKQNGNKSREQLIAHADDGLVLAGWNPGEGRTVPPISHEEFKKAWIAWIRTGAYAPSPKTK